MFKLNVIVYVKIKILLPPTPNFLLTLNAIHFLLAEMFKQSNCIISVMIIGNFLHLLIVVLPPFVIEF